MFYFYKPHQFRFLPFLVIPFLIIALLLTGMPVFAEQSQSETEFHRTSDRHDLYSAAYGNGVSVVVGADGVIKTSSDTEHWEIVESHTTVLLNSVIWSGKTFVAVGCLGEILVSSDGTNWKEAVSGTEKNLNSIAWNGTVFVAVGDRGTIVTSSDGINWTKRPLKIAYSISNILSGNGKFIATVSDTFNIILVSDNGTDWNAVQPSGENYGYYNAVFNGSQFFMNGKVPHLNEFVTVVSYDGINWTEVQNAPKIRSITSDGGKFTALGESEMQENGKLKQNIYTSENGTAWQTVTVNWGTYYSDLRFLYRCGDKYIGLKYSGDIFSSTDLLMWTGEKSVLAPNFEHITWNGSSLVAYNKDGVTMCSDDGMRWSNQNTALPIKSINQIYYFEHQTIVIGGTPAKLYGTVDGVNWKETQIDGLTNGTILQSGNSFLLKTGTELYVSTDAFYWERLDTNAPLLLLKDIATNGQKYVSVGGQSSIQGGEGNSSESNRIMAESSDMKTWNVTKSENTPALNAVVFANGMFVAVGDNGVILNSTDGTVWNQVSTDFKEKLLDLSWDGHRFVASGEKGTVLLSDDGNHWVLYQVKTSDSILKLIFTGKQYIGIGYRTIFAGTIPNQADIPQKKTFVDITNHWAKDSIQQMADKNFVHGVDDSHFEPDRPITRAEFAAILVRALGLKSVKDQNSFCDVNSDDWYFESIYAASENGILKGYEGGFAKPKNEITRQEAVVMAARAMKLKKVDTEIAPSEITTALSKFIDRDSISDWAIESTAICVKHSILNGNNGSMKPADFITRAESTAVIQRILYNIED